MDISLADSIKEHNELSQAADALVFQKCYWELDVTAESLFELVTDKDRQFFPIAVVKAHRLLNV